MFRKSGSTVFFISFFLICEHISYKALMTEQRSLIPAQRMREFTGVTHKGMDDGCAFQKQLHLPKPHLSPGEVSEQLPHYSSFMSDSVGQRVSLQQLFIACVILRSLMNPKFPLSEIYALFIPQLQESSYTLLEECFNEEAMLHSNCLCFDGQPSHTVLH